MNLLTGNPHAVFPRKTRSPRLSRHHHHCRAWRRSFAPIEVKNAGIEIHCVAFVQRNVRAIDIDDEFSLYDVDEFRALVLMRDGMPMRYFPIGAKADTHVPLRVVEDLEDGTKVELYLAAPDGLTGTVVVDLGLVEV